MFVYPASSIVLQNRESVQLLGEPRRERGRGGRGGLAHDVWLSFVSKDTISSPNNIV